MERKGGTRTVEIAEAKVDSKVVQRSLGHTKTLTAEEDKALRMRHGAGVTLDTPLVQMARPKTELADELLLMEMQLLRSFRARGAQAAARSAVTTAPSRTKDKIVRALRKKR